MFTNLKPYPEYTDSGQPWFGPIPVSWHALGARNLFAEVKSPGHEDADMLSVTIGRGVIRQSDLLTGSSKKDSSNLDKSKYKLVEPGDIAYNKMRAWQGAAGLSQHRGIVSPAYIVIRPRQGCGAYFHHLLRTPEFAKEAERWSYGITSDQWSLRPEHFKMIYFPFPPDSEQEAIVKYLGHANSRIDRAIAAKRKLIALLEEQKQAIINQAITRGLDPTVPLKDSGTPWLGEIPDHWQVWPIGRLARVGNGSTPSRTTPEFWHDGIYPWLNSSFANKREVHEADQFVTKRALAECHLPIVPPESVIVAITGQGKTRGKAALLKMEATINQHLAYLTPDPRRLIGPFLQAVLVAAYPELRRISNDSGSTKGALTCQDLKAFRVPVPPLVEQAQSLQWIRDETATAEAATVHTAQEIELLREFRTRLTADVVTGQLDIRAAAARLPELDLDDLVSDVGPDEDDLEADLAASLEEIDA